MSLSSPSGNYVPGEGPQPSAYMWLGEGPGRHEEAEERPFVGATGQFLDAVWGALKTRLGYRFGTDRRTVRIENVTRYLPADEKKGLTQAEVDRDRGDLITAFKKTKPRYVFAMGRWALEATVGRYLRGKGFNLDRGQVMDWVNGLTFRVPSLDDPDREMLVTIGYHPAAGLRSPSAAAKFFVAFRAFAQTVHDLGREVWPYPYNEDDNVIGADTESLAGGEPWCSTWSDVLRDQFVWAGKRPGVQTIHGACPKVVLHNLTYDWNVLLELGIKPWEFGEWHDTLPYVRSLQTEPGKLKLLVQRWLGEPRIEYEDLLRPYKKEAWGKFTAAASAAAATRSWWGIRDGAENALVTRIKALAKSEDPESIWEKFPERYRERVVRAVGQPPAIDLSKIPFPVAEKYAIQDARDVRRLYPIIRKKAEVEGTLAVAAQDEAMIPMLAAMERTGMPIDQGRLRALEVEMESETGRLLSELRRVAENPNFNPGSSDQVAGVLFYEIGVGGRRKKTATGKDSTSGQILDTIRADLLAKKAREKGLDTSDSRALELLELLAEYRHVTKLLSTNVRPMWEYLDANSRVHPRFKQGGYDDENGEPVVSGRYAMDRPNWLAFPAHSHWAKKARGIVNPGPGRVILVVDLDQIEMREMAHQSGDEVMREVFETGEDIHARTARYIFKVERGHERDQIPGIVGNSVTYRQASKTLGFLLLFGGLAYGYARKMAESGLLLTDEEAEASRDGWLRLYSGVPRFWSRMAEQAERTGKVVTPLGRPRYLPAIWSKDERFRAEAARQAGNHPIQGGAQERLKTGAIRVYSGLGRWRKRGYVEPLLTIHDELDFEVESGMAEEFGKWVVEEMTRDHGMKVPVKAKAAIGADWGDVSK